MTNNIISYVIDFVGGHKMRLSPLNIVNNYRTFVLNNYQNQFQPKLLNRLEFDSVSFSGKSKGLTDPCDRAFVNILVKDLELDEQGSAKLNKTVCDFLDENEINSLSDIGGEEYFDEQLSLMEKIQAALSLSEDLNEYLSSEIIERCDSGKDYIPRGMKRFNDDPLQRIFSNEESISTNVLNFFDSLDDDNFYKFAKKLLRLSPDASYEFRATINGFLQEENIGSIKELFGSDEYINEQACLLEKLENKFDLSENETFALHLELLTRSQSGGAYEPRVSPYVKDANSLEKIVKDGGYNYETGDGDFYYDLYRQMAHEASEMDYECLFDIFKIENDPAKSKTVEFIENSNLSREQKDNLILDLIANAKNPEKLASSLPKHSIQDNFYAGIQTKMITDKIIEEFFDNSGSGMKSVEEAISKEIKRIFPEHVEGGENCSIQQIAFELADQFDLPGGCEKQIEKIIKELITDTKTSDAYVVGKLLKD